MNTKHNSKLINTNFFSDIESSQINFYLKKFSQYQDSYKSLSWNNKKTQDLRFDSLTKLFDLESRDAFFSVHEIGCGLGHFGEYLKIKFPNVSYSGSDIVNQMIEVCKKKFPSQHFVCTSIIDSIKKLKRIIGGYDYYCLSGTFHTKLDNSIEKWEEFVLKSIRNMFDLAKKGIAFNFLTSYSTFYDKSLYYCDPCVIFNWCMKNLSRFIAIRHDIPLYEFTVFVYKESFIKDKYYEPEFQKYFKR